MTAEDEHVQEDEVRRLLADVGADPEPLPMHVAARLDDLLADLIDERSRSTNVVPLAPRRRWPARLVAAAAVCVVVAGVGTVLTRNDGGPRTARSATAGTERAASAPEAAGGQASAIPPGNHFNALQAMGLPVLHRETMAGDLLRLARRSPSMRTQDADGAIASPPTASRAPLACPPLTAHQRESWIPAQLDGRLVAVLVGPVHAGKRVARVYSCERRGAPLAVNPVAAP